MILSHVLQVPVLYDKQTKTIVSNESADIIRMFATECQVCPLKPASVISNKTQIVWQPGLGAWSKSDFAKPTCSERLDRGRKYEDGECHPRNGCSCHCWRVSFLPPPLSVLPWLPPSPLVEHLLGARTPLVCSGPPTTRGTRRNFSYLAEGVRKCIAVTLLCNYSWS